MTQETAAKKDTQKLQRAIIDGLEDVKAQDIQVFNTEHLSPLFERVIVASGTSNRQTKALAASVRDAVREAGFPKPRIWGEVPVKLKGAPAKKAVPRAAQGASTPARQAAVKQAPGKAPAKKAAAPA